MKIYIIIFVLFITSILIMVQVANIMNEQYPDLYEYKEPFSGVVIKNKMGMAGTRIISFKDKPTFFVGSFYKSNTIKEEQTKLKAWDQSSLNIFLQYGDSIFKCKNSDTIWVYRNGIEYMFIDKAYRNK